MQTTTDIASGHSGYIGLSALTKDYVLCYPVQPNWWYDLIRFDEELALRSVNRFKLKGSTRQAYLLSNAPAPLFDGEDLYFILPTAVGEKFDTLVLLDAAAPDERQIDIVLPSLVDSRDYLFTFTSIERGVFGVAIWYNDPRVTEFLLCFWSWQDIQEGIAPTHQLVPVPGDRLNGFDVSHLRSVTLPVSGEEKNPSLVLAFDGTWDGGLQTGVVSLEIAYLLEGVERERKLVLGDLILSTVSMRAADASGPLPTLGGLTIGFDGDVRALVVERSHTDALACLYTRHSAEQWQVVGGPLGRFSPPSKTFFNYVARSGTPTLQATNQLLQTLRLPATTQGDRRQLSLDALVFTWRDYGRGEHIQSISVGRDGEVFAVPAGPGASGAGKRVLRLDRQNESWVPIATPVDEALPEQIAVNDASFVWYRGIDHKILQLDSRADGESWRVVDAPDEATWIAPGPSGSFWAILGSDMYFHDPQGSEPWSLLPSLPNGVTPCEFGGWSPADAACLGSDGQVYLFNGRGWKLHDLDIVIDHLAVSTQGPTAWIDSRSNLVEWRITGQSTNLVKAPAAHRSALAFGGPTDLWVVTQNRRVFTLVNTAAPDIDDLGNWMSRIPDIEYKRMIDVTLPSTHDTATYEVTSSISKELPGPLRSIFNINFSNSLFSGIVADIGAIWARAQSRTVAQQLADGIRMLDLRPSWFNARGKFFNRHLFYTVEFESVLQELEAFLRTSERELVVVTTADFDSTLINDKARSDQLVELIVQYLGNYLVPNREPDGKNAFTPAKLANSTIGDLTDDGRGGFQSRVIFFYNNALLDNTRLFNGFKDNYYVDVSASTNSALTTLSWIDRATEAQIQRDVGNFFRAKTPKYELRRLALLHNPELAGYLATSSNFNPGTQINRIDIDWYQLSDIVTLAIELTRANALVDSAFADSEEVRSRQVIRTVNTLRAEHMR